MKDGSPNSVRDLLLTRRGLAFISTSGPAPSEHVLRALQIELAGVGFALSSRLVARLGKCSSVELADFHNGSLRALQNHLGGDKKHEPLFRRFPEGIPDDTLVLWWSKVLVHFLQAEDQPCLFCERTGTTYVLNPCCHVVCSACFDGANYSACPVCEHHVDRSSPFFKETPVRTLPSERVVFKRIDLGEDLDLEARSLFVSLCERKQALSPNDRDALGMLVKEYGTKVLAWIPESIPVRENAALIFGTLSLAFPPAEWLPKAKAFLSTATDVLRFIAVRSGKDGSLQKETVFKPVVRLAPNSGFWKRIANALGAHARGPLPGIVNAPIQVNRFKVAKMSRGLRRDLLGILEGIPENRLIEDMLRHRSYWVWVGEFLHPHEYADRFPKVAKAFHVIRKKAPDGTAAPEFHTWYAKVTQAFTALDSESLLNTLSERPGEFGRRLDQLLRSFPDPASRQLVTDRFLTMVPNLATPILLTMRSHFRIRDEKAGIRVYWPKGSVSKGVASPDNRDPIPRAALDPLVQGLERELLKRFAAKPAFTASLIDQGLRTVMVPFNERTAARSAVSLPRGSRIPVSTGKVIRLFLHWCQPDRKGTTTDLDLSVAFYDTEWKYAGVCSYYQLKHMASSGPLIAQSAGDTRDAPWPDGAAEFVDLHREPALESGIRYVVMVVNAYAGMPFSQLERSFAGLMFRDDAGGRHFDPRTVRLKFALDGENGIYMPLVLDLENNELHWLDVHSKGSLEMNNVETSKSAIARIGPDLIQYFASGTRPSLYELALLHAAARTPVVYLRDPSGVVRFKRESGEAILHFHARLVAEQGGVAASAPDANGPALLALLFQGDLDLPENSLAYALFRDQVTPSLAAGDLIS